MSRTAHPYGNGPSESFVATLLPSEATAQLMAFDYIESSYNRRRRHGGLGYLSPVDFENQLSSTSTTPESQSRLVSPTRVFEERS